MLDTIEKRVGRQNSATRKVWGTLHAIALPLVYFWCVHSLFFRYYGFEPTVFVAAYLESDYLSWTALFGVMSFFCWMSNMKSHLLPALMIGAAALSLVSHQVVAVPLVQRGTRWVEMQQADEPKPAVAAPAEDKDDKAETQLRAAVVAVRGTVQIRQAEDKKWAAAKPGDVLGAGADIRTGLNSAVQLKIEPGHTITIDRISVVKLLTLVKNQDVVKTDVGMKYGRTRYDVEAAGSVHDAKIHTPGTTLAIRGTSTGTQTDAFTDSTWVIKGAVNNTNKLRREMVRMDSSTGKAVVTSDLVTPAAFAKNKTKNDTKGEFAGRQGSENTIVEQYASGELDNRQSGIDAEQQFARREGFQFAAVGVFGDVFDLDIFWTPQGVNNSNVDFTILDSLGGTITSQGPTIVRSGQSTQGQFISSPADDDGSLGFGFEAVQYGPQVPSGNFLVTVNHISGDRADVSLTGSLQSLSGQFGSEFFSVDSGNPQAQYIVNPKNQTITAVGGN